MTMARCCSSPSRSTERARAGLRTLAGALLGLALCAPQAQAQTPTASTPLSFGSFTAGAGGGSISVTSGGGRSKTGTVVLASQGAPATAALLNVSGTPSATFAITLPVDGVVTLSDGSHTMAVNGFVSSPSLTGALSGGGTAVINVGATLTVNPSQAPGSYSGSFDVTLNYN